MSKLALQYFQTLDLRGLKGKRALVLQKIIERVTFDRKPIITCGVDWLMEQTGVSRRSMTNILNDLENAGFIARKPRGAKKRKEGRLTDQIELRGFASWKRNQSKARRYKYDGSLSEHQRRNSDVANTENQTGLKTQILRTYIRKDIYRGTSGQISDVHEDDWASLESLARWEPCGGLH